MNNIFNVAPQVLAAYLYLHMGETPPDPVLDDEGNIDLEADNRVFSEWALGTESFAVNVQEVERFLNDLSILIVDLRNENDHSQYMTHFYNAAKRTFDGDKTRIRTWFTWLYLIVLQRPEGPRWGDFVQICGVENFIDILYDRFDNLYI